jgi:hypothetical protein
MKILSGGVCPAHIWTAAEYTTTLLKRKIHLTNVVRVNVSKYYPHPKPLFRGRFLIQPHPQPLSASERGEKNRGFGMRKRRQK